MAGLSSIFQSGDTRDPRAILAGALAWWEDAGVTDPLSDSPRAWLDRPVPVRKVRDVRAPSRPSPTTGPRASREVEGDASPPIAGRSPGSGVEPLPSPAMPDEIGAFREWFATAPLPGLTDGGRRLIGEGPVSAAVVFVIARPTARESLLHGPHRRLLDAMMSAAGLSSEAVAVIPVMPSHVGPHPVGAVAEAYRSILARHLALVGTGRALLLGDGPCRTLLEEPASTLRGRWHDVKHDGATLRVMASFDLDTLLAQPLCKPHAWADLLAFTEDLS